MKIKNEMTRREFLRQSGRLAAVGAGAMSRGFGDFRGSPGGASLPEGKLLWGYLIHLGYNMWADRPVEGWGSDKAINRNLTAHPFLRCDQSLWDDIFRRMSEAGMNLAVIDLGEGIHYKSHPELAAEGAWDHGKVRTELKKIRSLGIEVVPKMNFSTAHDAWLKEYSRQVSTPAYYRVCADLIEEACDLFDGPRFFHLGYDEETAEHQAKYAYAVIRQHELWWHDFFYFAETVEKHKARPWIWSDFAWRHSETFYEKMPKRVLQSNWYYGTEFHRYPDGFGTAENEQAVLKQIKTYIELDDHGFDQIPTASNWSARENFRQTVEFCRKHLRPERLKGFLQTPWAATLEVFRQRHMEAIEEVRRTIKNPQVSKEERR